MSIFFFLLFNGKFWKFPSVFKLYNFIWSLWTCMYVTKIGLFVNCDLATVAEERSRSRSRSKLCKFKTTCKFALTHPTFLRSVRVFWQFANLAFFEKKISRSFLFQFNVTYNFEDKTLIKVKDARNDRALIQTNKSRHICLFLRQISSFKI